MRPPKLHIDAATFSHVGAKCTKCGFVFVNGLALVPTDDSWGSSAYMGGGLTLCTRCERPIHVTKDALRTLDAVEASLLPAHLRQQMEHVRTVHRFYKQGQGWS